MHKCYNPSIIAPPLGKYSHAVEVPPNACWLHVSGQVGGRTDGSIASSFEEQADCAWRNLMAILADADMGSEHIVKYSTFITSADYIAAFRAVRDRYIGALRPASTLLVISGLAAPELLIEIELIAAKS